MKKLLCYLIFVILLIITSAVSFAAEAVQVENVVSNYCIDSSQNNVSVQFDIKNNTSIEKEFKIYVALYDKNNRLISVKSEADKLDSDQAKHKSYDIDISDNVYKYGKIFVWNFDMVPISKAIPITVQQLENLVIEENITLTKDMECNNLTLNNGIIDLNGYKLYICGNLLQSDGTIHINNGKLFINGDYQISDSGILNMNDENDRVYVGGNFMMHSSQSHSDYLTNGVLEIKGDFSQVNWNGTGSANTIYNFDASGNHKVVFSGDEMQKISFQNYIYSGFANAEFENPNIQIASSIRGWTLKKDMLISNDVDYALPLDLNGYTLEIQGNYKQKASLSSQTEKYSDMIINGGSLVVANDYTISGSGVLNMTNENDRVYVGGNFMMHSSQSHSDYLTNGVLEIKGDFSQVNWNGTGSANTIYNFDASGNHKVVFSGDKMQKISFQNYIYSGFNILILTKPYETGYTFSHEPCWNALYQADAVSIHYGGQTGAYAPTGNYSREFTDITIVSAAGDMAIKRTYNSHDKESSVFSQGWTLSVSARMTDEGNGYKQVKLPDGSTAMFKELDGAYESLNSRNTLTKNEDGTYSLISKSQVKYMFSNDGKIISMQDRYGNTTAFETNSEGNIASLTEPSGKRYSFTYSDNKLTEIKDETSEITVTYEYSNGRLEKAVNPAGVCTYYEYDNNGRLAKILDHDRNTVEEIAYNSDDKVDYVIDADSNKSVYTYDLAEGKTIITDSNGRGKIQWYDSTFNVTKNQDAEGGITVTEYNMTDGLNKYNEPRAITDRNGRNTYYERDERGNVIRQSNPDGSYKTYAYDENNNIISERDENGNYSYYVYDDTKTKLLKQVKPLDGVTEYSEAANQELFAITEYTYYDNHKIKGLVKSKTEPEGLISEFDYDDSGMLKSITVTDTKDGTSSVTKYSYNKSGLLEYEISPDGYKTTYEYDSAGNPTKLTVNNGNAVSVMQYDSAGRKVKEISPNEYTLNGLNSTGKTYSYYPSGRIKSETDALGASTQYTYDLYGNIQTETKPDGSVYKYEYDGINRKVKEYFKDKNSTDFVLTNECSYSINSSKNSETTETVYLNNTESVATTNEFDYAERLIRQKRADGTEITKEYDGKGNIKSETDANGNIKEYKYNALDMVIQEKIPFDGNYQYKKYSYDKAGNCIKEEVTNQVSGEAEEYSVTEYGYNSRGLLTMTAAYDNGEIKSAAQFVYDKSGNKVRVYTGLSSPLAIKGIDDVTENGDSDYSVRKYEYDYSGNVIKAIDAMGMEEGYSYDNNGNCISYADRNGNIVSYEYDIMNRLTRKSSGDSSYSYTYDSMGNKVSVSGDYNAGYTYDSKGNLLSEETANSEKLYSYDLQGSRTGFILTYGEGEKLNMSYSYDSMGRVSQILSNNDLLASYSYDNNGNRTSVVYDNGCTTSYRYNYANLVTEVLNMSANDVISEFDYTYYTNGKQKSKTGSQSTENYTYDDLGRLTSVNDTTYEYDDYNNRIKMNDTSYSYDKNGRLIDDAYLYDSNGNLLTDEKNIYVYDVWNRLIGVNDESYAYDDLTGRISAGETNIVSDGINMAYTSDGIIERIYLNGVNPIAVDETEERKYYFFNAHGDVVNLTDNSGNVVKSYNYDAFGNEINMSDDDTNPIRYAGQYYDSESGNYYTNSRYYNAETGRFLSQDSFYGSDADVLSLNQYTYCYNDPIQYVDLSGNSVLSAAKKLSIDSLQKAGKDTLKTYLKDQYTSAIGIPTENKDYFGEFGKKVGTNILKGAGKNVSKKLGIATEYSVFLPVIEDGIKNVTEEFNSSQKENRDFSMGNVVGNTASGVVLSYVKSAPGVGTVYDMCLDLSNGEIFKNLTIKTFTKGIDVIAGSMGYEPINWNAGSDLYRTDSKQFSSDYNSFRSKGWSNNTSYWYALTQSYSRKVQRGNSWLRNNGYIN